MLPAAAETLPTTRLSSLLRAETRAAHAAAEKRFVRAAKARPGSGPFLLMALNLGLVAWLERAAQRLPPGRLREEIGVFAAAVLEAHGAGPEGGGDAPVLVDEAAIVGAAYAVCGSTLGASVLADAWREERDPRWIRFCAASRALERRWPLFAAALDEWGGARAQAEAHAAVAGARDAFAHAGALVAALADTPSSHGPDASR
jgi:heme oxygenase